MRVPQWNHNDPDSGYENAHIVLSRNWIATEAYHHGQLQKNSRLKKL
jgi:hypothetical protein